MKRTKKLFLGIVCALFVLFALFGFLLADGFNKFVRVNKA